MALSLWLMRRSAFCDPTARLYRPSENLLMRQGRSARLRRILQVDGCSGCDALAEPRRGGGAPLTLAYCWAHARRKLHAIHLKDGSPIAAEGLRRISEICKVEATVRGQSAPRRVDRPDGTRAASVMFRPPVGRRGDFSA